VVSESRLEKQKQDVDGAQLEELNLDMPIETHDLDSYEFGKAFSSAPQQTDSLVKNVCGHYISSKSLDQHKSEYADSCD
jgi:hypothetical protein